MTNDEQLYTEARKLFEADETLTVDGLTKTLQDAYDDAHAVELPVYKPIEVERRDIHIEGSFKDYKERQEFTREADESTY